MTITHHPSEDLLLAYAAGRLDPGQHLAVATHLLPCAQCRGLVASLEAVGGAVLDDLAPTMMAGGALDAVEALLDSGIAAPLQPAETLSEIPGLPNYASRLPADRWTWVAPQLHLRRIRLAHPSASRVFLLRAQPGVRRSEERRVGKEC